MQPKSWRTTAAGILVILVTVAGAAQTLLQGGHVDFNSVATSILAGLGLIKAGDHANFVK